MSLNATLAPARSRRPASRTLRRLLVAGFALALVAALVGLVGAIGLSLAEPVPAARNPFGTGLREAAPSGAGLGGVVLALQSQFYRMLTGALSALRRDGEGLPWLLTVGFAYGVFHAAGPGHGKGIISGYLLASRRTLVRGLTLSLGAALLQAVVAIAAVLGLVLALNATVATINATAGAVEVASFAAVVIVGLVLLWRRTARVVPPAGVAVRPDGVPHRPADDCACCDGAHMPSASAVERAGTGREAAGIVLAAGLRPCSGAIILLVFAASQGMLAAGLAGVIAMALGTAMTTGAFATLAVLAKSAALRIAAGRPGLAVALPWLEVVAAALVVVFGAALLVGTAGSS